MFSLKRMFILCSVVVLKDKDCVSALEQSECFKDDFGAGSFGILNRSCLDLPPFDVVRYADFTDILEKPPGATPFFMAAKIDSGSCIQNTEGLNTVKGTDVLFYFFTKNPQSVPTVALWIVEDINNEVTIHTQPLLFSSNNDGWKSGTFVTPRDANIRVSHFECFNIIFNILNFHFFLNYVEVFMIDGPFGSWTILQYINTMH